MQRSTNKNRKIKEIVDVTQKNVLIQLMNEKHCTTLDFSFFLSNSEDISVKDCCLIFSYYLLFLNHFFIILVDSFGDSIKTVEIHFVFLHKIFLIEIQHEEKTKIRFYLYLIGLNRSIRFVFVVVVVVMNPNCWKNIELALHILWRSLWISSYSGRKIESKKKIGSCMQRQKWFDFEKHNNYDWYWFHIQNPNDYVCRKKNKHFIAFLNSKRIK